MRFSTKIWANFYREIHGYGNKLKKYYYCNNIPEGMKLSRDTVALYEREIEILLDRVSMYMDGCGMALKPTPWRYEPNDKSTWHSHESFAYRHLLKRAPC